MNFLSYMVVEISLTDEKGWRKKKPGKNKQGGGGGVRVGREEWCSLTSQFEGRAVCNDVPENDIN